MLYQTIYHLLELFELAPDLVMEKINLLEFIVLLEDPHLFVYFLTVTQNYIRLSNQGRFDAKRVYNRRREQDAYRRLMSSQARDIERCYYFYQKVIVEKRTDLFFSKKTNFTT